MRNTRFRTLLHWIAASAIAWAVFMPINFHLDWSIGKIGSLQLSALLLDGAIIGIAQYLVLRRYIANGYWWIIATFGGVLVGNATYWISNDTRLAIAIGIISVAVFQWITLRRYLKNTWSWILAKLFALGISLASSILLAPFFYYPLANYSDEAVITLFFAGGILGAVFGLFSGIYINRIVKRPRYPNGVSQIAP